MKEIRRKLTYANVMSSFAVFLVLGGATAVAATYLPKNSVGSAHLKAGAVTSTKIHKRAITGSKIADGSITGSDLAPDSVTGSAIANGSIDGRDIDPTTLGSVPIADQVEGVKEFSFFLSPDSKDQVTDVDPFGIDAVCRDNGELPTDIMAELSILSRTDGSLLVNRPEVVDSEVRLLPVGEFRPLAVADLRFTESIPGASPGERFTPAGNKLAVSTSGVSLALEGLGVGINLEGHEGECFFTGSVSQVD